MRPGHILRDLAGAAETYPDAHWPAQISQARQGLIHAANTARAQGLPAIPGEVAASLIHAFRHGVVVGLSQIPRIPGRNQGPCCDLLECLRDRQADVLRFTTDLRIPLAVPAKTTLGIWSLVFSRPCGGSGPGGFSGCS